MYSFNWSICNNRPNYSWFCLTNKNYLKKLLNSIKHFAKRFYYFSNLSLNFWLNSIRAIWLIFIIYAWVIIGILNKKYNLKHFIYIVSCSGIILSIAAFFIYGVEELPYPIGAVRFNTESIILTSILLFIFSLPALIIRMGSLELVSTKIKDVQKCLEKVK